MLYQQQVITTRPLTTAHLAQTMTLLELTNTELRQKIESELAKNPALELIEDRYCPTCQRPLAFPGPCPICSRPQNHSIEEPIVFVSPREDFSYPSNRIDKNESTLDDYSAEYDDLPTYVLHQIAPELNQEDYHITAHILTSLDDDGLLNVPLIEIAQYHHVALSKINDIRKIIQRADPIGVGSQNPTEALLVQIEILEDTMVVPPLASEVISTGLEQLSKRQYSELAHAFNIPISNIRHIADFVSKNLNPYPARAYWGDIHQNQAATPDAYHHPDIIINYNQQQTNSPLIIEVISPLAGKLRINPLFKEALHNAPESLSKQWQQDYEKASLLVKCIQQRNNTIVRLMQRIATQQKEFILNGDANLLPMTRANMANALEVHESTVSRAVSNKTVQMPNGRIIPLSKFFDRSLHIRTELIDIIENEKEPLTDSEIVNILNKKGFNIARRTVAKYRSIEGIMPAHLRAKFRKSNISHQKLDIDMF